MNRQATTPARASRTPPWLLAALVCLGVVACTDIRDYRGTWTGGIITNPNLREGFAANTEITLVVADIDRGHLEGSLTIGPSQEATSGFTDATLIPMAQATNDVLGDLDFDGEPLATYLFHVAADDPAEEHATVLISAHPDDQLEVRVMRYDLYGVFRLRR